MTTSAGAAKSKGHRPIGLLTLLESTGLSGPAKPESPVIRAGKPTAGWTSSGCPRTCVEGRSPPSKGRSPPSKGRSPPSKGRSPPSKGRSPPSKGRSPPSKGRSPPSKGRSPPSKAGRSRQRKILFAKTSRTGGDCCHWCPKVLVDNIFQHQFAVLLPNRATGADPAADDPAADDAAGADPAADDPAADDAAGGNRRPRPPCRNRPAATVRLQPPMPPAWMQPRQPTTPGNVGA